MIFHLSGRIMGGTEGTIFRGKVHEMLDAALGKQSSI